MWDPRKNARRQSALAAFCGMAAGLSVVIMLMGGIIPAATYAVPMLCGLLLLPILLEFGAKAAWITYLATALIALLMGFDKEAAFFYIFIGYYPIVKWKLDRIRSRPLRLAAKLGLFTGAIVIMYGFMYLLFPLQAFAQEFREMGIWLSTLFVLVYDLCMLIYDRLLLPLSMIYINRIRPRLSFLLRQ